MFRQAEAKVIYEELKLRETLSEIEDARRAAQEQTKPIRFEQVINAETRVKEELLARIEADIAIEEKRIEELQAKFHESNTMRQGLQDDLATLRDKLQQAAMDEEKEAVVDYSFQLEGVDEAGYFPGGPSKAKKAKK